MTSTDDQLLQPLLDAFEAVLERESTALRSRDAAALDRALADKTPLLEQLARAAVGDVSESVREQLVRIRERNEVNGIVIRHSAAVNERLLTTLRGEPRADLYGRPGARATARRSRNISEA